MARRSGSAIFAQAVDLWHMVRDEYSLLVESQHAKASDELNGVLLNARGKRARIDSFSLFSGTTARAHAYASEELIDWWTRNPRVTFEQYERARISTLGVLGGAA